jgi:thiol-disulfide isomerase/thioredoxin
MKKALLALLLVSFVMPSPASTTKTAALIVASRLGQEVGKPVDLKFTAVDGKEVDLASLRGKVVLIDFWATWCPPCRGEVPNVVAAYQKFHGQGFEIVGISLDQDKDALMAFTKQNGMVWPQYFDGKGWDNSISSGFGIQSIPAMWLVDQKGVLVTTDGRDDLAGQVGKLLGTP